MFTKRDPGVSACYEKAEPDEPMFVLLGRDPIAFAVVGIWSYLRVLVGYDDEAQLEEARQCAFAMREYALSRGKILLVERSQQLLNKLALEVRK